MTRVERKRRSSAADPLRRKLTHIKYTRMQYFSGHNIRLPLLTKYCKRPLFVDIVPYACERPGINELRIVHMKCAPSSTAVADARSLPYVETPVDITAAIN